MEKTVRGLNNLQVYCQDRPQSYQRELGQRYTKFLEVLAVYTDFHTHERQRESARRLVWVCDVRSHCGGLADRIKGITHALVLAMLSRRVLLLDWHGREFGEQTYLESNLIDWRLTEEERKKVYPGEDYNDDYEQDKLDSRSNEDIADSVAFIHILSVLGGLGVDMSAEDLRISLDAIEGRWTWILLASNMEPSSLVNTTKTASLEWIQQGMAGLGLNTLTPDEIDALVGLVFRYLFRFSGEVPGEVEGARRVLGLQDQPYVGVHVRTGFAGSVDQESVNHPKLYRESWQWEDTLSCGFRHATEHLGSDALVFVATDSNLVKNKTLDVGRYRGRVRSLESSLVHLDLLEKAPHEAGETEREGVLSVWVEMVLLAESHSIVMGESGFAFLAQSLCFTPSERKINGVTCKPF